jgi:hypothetical protein
VSEFTKSVQDAGAGLAISITVLFQAMRAFEDKKICIVITIHDMKESFAQNFSVYLESELCREQCKEDRLALVAGPLST